MSGYGGSPWGGSPWGSGVLTSASVESITATSTRTVKVNFLLDMLCLSSIGEHDVLNAKNWRISSNGRFFTPLSVRKVGSSARIFEVALLQDLSAFTVEHLLTIYAYDALLNPLSEAVELPFGGCVALRVPQPRQQQYDLLNTAYTTDESNAGLQVDSSGGYVVHSGKSLLEKLLYRRITTIPGAFSHLSDVEYGLGLRAKALITDFNLLKLKIEEQAKLEPTVTAAVATLQLQSSSGILTVQLKVESTEGINDFAFDFATR